MSSRPFRSVEAAEQGYTRGQLGGPSLRRLFPGVHVDRSATVTVPLLVAAARQLLPADSVATSVTALRLHGVPAGTVWPLRFVTTHPHQVRRPRLEVARVGMLPLHADGVVAPASAFATSAGSLDLVELVAAGDRLVRSGRTTAPELVAVATTFRGRGARLARRSAALVRDRVDSAQETELRLCLVLAGLPEPECNPLLGTGEPIGRVDLRYREYRVVLEYEGDQHRLSTSQWNRDIERHEQLGAEALAVVRVTAERMRNPRAVVARTLRALRAGGYRGPDPVFSPEWCALFSSSARSRRLDHAFEVLERAVDGSD